MLSKSIDENDLTKVFQKIKNDKALENHFFKKLASTSKPDLWLSPLNAHHYFNPEKNPKPQEVPNQPGFYSIPHWNVLDYLENVANKNAKEPSEEVTTMLVEIVDTIITYRENGERIDNYRTDWFMLKIISTFPIEKIENQHIEFVRDALDSKWGSTLIAAGISKTILPKLIEHESKELILKLLDVMFDFHKEDRTYGKEYQSIMEDYWLHEALKKHKSDIVRICGTDAADFAIEKMKSILQMNDAHFNNIWIPAIEDHPQNRHADKYECILVHFIRDTYEQSEASQVKDRIGELLKEKYPIFKRIAVHVINNHYSELNDLFWQWDGNPLDEYGLKHEIYELLKNNCKSFDDSQIDKLFEWIETKDYYISDEIKDDEEKKNKVLAYRKREWLSALLKSNKPKVNEKYEKCKLINPAELDHPGFDYWMDIGWVGHISPITSEELRKKPNSEIADYVRVFKEEKGWKTPTIDGLIDALRNCASNNPEKFSVDLEPFLNVQRMYQHSLLWGLWEAWRNKKSFEWKELLSFILKTIESKDFWGEKFKEGRYNYRDSMISQISELINDGTRDDSHAFDPALLPEAENILRILVEKTESCPLEMGDLITSVLNATRGKIFVAMVNYSLRYARLYKKDKKEKWIDSIKNDFEKRLDRKYEPSLEFSVILGEYLANLFYLNKKWVENNINKIFSKDNEIHWKAVFTGYLYGASTVYKETYDLLSNHNHYDKALKTAFEDEHTGERLVQHICIGYIEEWEKLDDKNSLLRKLIDKQDSEQLSEIVSFFWMLRDKTIDKTKIKPLWNVLFEIASQNIDKPEYQNILSNLSKWLSLIDEIDDEIFEWLKLSAKYVEINHNTSFFVESLAKYVDKEPEKVGKLYVEMLNSNIYPNYQDDVIKAIVETLYKKGQKEIADRICNRYGEEGFHFDFLRKLYEQNKS